MSYIIVTGTFRISADVFTFEIRLPTKAKKFDRSKARVRAMRHFRLYWDDSHHNIPTGDYDWKIDSVQLVEGEVDLNRVEASMSYRVSKTNGEHQSLGSGRRGIKTNSQRRGLPYL